MSDSYKENIYSRNFVQFLKGLIARIPRFVHFQYAILIGKNKGAKLGKNICIFPSLAKKINKNVSIGDNTSISKCEITSALFKISIGRNCIIGHDVKFLMSTHDIDNSEWTHFRASEGLIIEDYVWICPYSIILPSVKYIGRGAVIGAGSVVTKDVEPMSIIAGNPAKKIRNRKCVHSDLIVEALLGGDLKTYIKTWLKRKK